MVLEDHFCSVFVPKKTVTMDRNLLAFKGHHHTLQHNLSKLGNQDLKVYKLFSSNGPEAGYRAAFKI